MSRTILRNGIVVTENGCEEIDVTIEDEKIAALTLRNAKGDLVPGTQEIDCKGLVILPGAIDTHSHFFDPGEASLYRDDFYTATMSAAAGGYTTCIEMPQSDPVVVTETAFEKKKREVKKKAVVDVALWGAVMPSKLDEIPRLRKLGAVGFKAFTSDAGPDFEMCTDEYLLEGMKQVKESGAVIGIHAENNAICNYLTDYFRQQPVIHPEDHESSRPWYAELEAIRRCILFSKVTGAKTMICHMTIPEGAVELKEAKNQGIPLFVETCAHYLTFDTDTLKKCGPFARCNPPLRSPERKEKLWESIFDGTIDVIGSDHAAYTEEEKRKGKTIFDAPGGFPGIQLILPALLTEGVNRRGLSLKRFAELTSTNAAKLFGLYPSKGSIRVGADADLAIVDLHAPWKYTSELSFSKGKSKFYPHEGEIYEAKIIRTIVRGKTVYENGTIQAQPGYGKFIEG